MMRLIRALLALASLGGPFPAWAEEDPTREACEAAVAQAHALAATLPVKHASRYFAESHLKQALAEAGNGEFDECLERAELAMDEVRELRHVLKPGESIWIASPIDPDEMIEVARGE
jgi:hypothetical protein